MNTYDLAEKIGQTIREQHPEVFADGLSRWERRVRVRELVGRFLTAERAPVDSREAARLVSLIADGAVGAPTLSDEDVFVVVGRRWVETVIAKAEEAFWAVVAAGFPEVSEQTALDFGVSAELGQSAEKAVKLWLAMNHPGLRSTE